MTQEKFVAENAELDRAFLAGEVAQFVRASAAESREELADGVRRGSQDDVEGEADSAVGGNANGP